LSEEYEQPSEEHIETEREEEEPRYSEFRREEQPVPPPAPPPREAPAYTETRREEPVYAKTAIDHVVLDDEKGAEDEEEEDYIDRVKLRSYSSMILFFPSFIISLTFGITQLLLNRYRGVPLDVTTVNSGYMDILGIIFFIFFSMNLILIAFDFNRARSIIIALLIVIVVGTFFLLNAIYSFLESIQLTMRVYFSTQVYFALAILLFVILVVTLIAAHTNYYIVEGNELLHRKGLLGGIERHPANNMTIIKEYPDIIEWGLFKFGTLILTPPRETKSIVLKNVPNIDKKEKAINEILSRLKVDIN
jgi:cation transport ATPase